MDIEVCGVCGSGWNSHLIVKCARCGDYEHCYCMKMVAWETPREWYCDKCQEDTNGVPEPSQGGQRETSKLHHSHSNVVHQISPKSPNRFENSKVKFLPSEEAVLLNRGRPPFVRSRLVLSQPRKASSPPTTKHLSNMNYVSASKSDTKVQAIKGCADASHSQTKHQDRLYAGSAMQQRQVHPSSPSNMKQSSNMKSISPGRKPSKASSPPTTNHLSMNCVSPSKSDTKVQALKGCAGASHSQTKPEDRSYSAMQQRQVHPASPSSMKQPFKLKLISPGRNDMQVQNLKRSAAARHDQAKICDSPYFAMRESQLHPASSPHVKQFSNMNCLSSNRTDTQVYAGKRSAAASHDQANIDYIDMDCETRPGGSLPIHEYRTSEPVKVKDDSPIEQKAREKKIVNADKGEINSHTEFGPREKGILCTADEDTAEVGSLNQNKDMILISSTVEYSRRPAPSICWTGCFHVFHAGKKLNLGEFKAYFPSKVSHKVNDIVKIMPTDLQLELLPRMDDWPKSFQNICPVHEDIGVFFFSNKSDGCEKIHSNLLEESCNYVLRAYIHEIKLLIYSSEVLPPDSQWIDGENYLWGLFVRPKGKSDPWRSGSKGRQIQG